MNIHYDQKNGLGSVPDNQIVDYKGFKCWIYPEMFLRLARRIYLDPQDASYLFLKNAIRRGKPIGSPFFSVSWNESKPVWEVTSHEGRHRMQAIKDLWPQELVEIHIFPDGGTRARDITPAMAQSFMEGVFAEDKTFVKNPTSKIELAGKTISPMQQTAPPLMETQLQKVQQKNLNEIGDSVKPFPFEFIKGTKTHVEYAFVAYDKLFTVHASELNQGAVRVDFEVHSIKKQKRQDNPGEVFSIYKTIQLVIEDIIRRSDPDIFIFQSADDARNKIIKVLVSKIPSEKYTLISKRRTILLYKYGNKDVESRAKSMLNGLYE